MPDAAIKHLIIISDGDPSPPNGGTITRAEEAGRDGIDGGRRRPRAAGSTTLLEHRRGHGREVLRGEQRQQPAADFQREARRVARPLIWDKHSVQPQVKMPSHEILGGIERPLPPLTGYVMTNKKEGNPLVETLLTSPEPAGDENNTLLAGWTYGLGKAVAFTSDAGARWTTDWTRQPMYDKLFGQMVRWSMRPAGGSGKFTVASEMADGQVRVVVNALDKNDEFLNFLSMSAHGRRART